MVEPFWDALRRLSNDENSPPESGKEPSHKENSENSFLAALPVVRKIVRRRLASFGQTEAPDLEQGIVLRLLNWREKYHEKSEEMSPGEWESFAARTAYNETNRHFSKSAAHLPLDEASAIESSNSVVGESDAEFKSLAQFVWQETCQLSLRQRRALLLHSRKLIVYFLKAGVSEEELAQSLALTEGEWREIESKLPLSDTEIARFFGGSSSNGEHLNLESAINSIKKARHEARCKLRLLTNK
jgi:hypothetical protein